MFAQVYSASRSQHAHNASTGPLGYMIVEVTVNSTTMPSFSSSSIWCQDNIRGMVLDMEVNEWHDHGDGSVDCSAWPHAVRIKTETFGVYGFWVSASLECICCMHVSSALDSIGKFIRVKT